MFIVRHFRSLLNLRAVVSAVELRPVKLIPRQAFDSFQTRIGQVGGIELGRTQIRAAQIGTT